MLLLLAILSLAMVNCKKDKSSDDQNSETVETKPVPVTITTTDNSSTLKNLPQMIIDRINANYTKAGVTATTTTTVNNYEYDGRHIIKITSDDGTDIKVKEYYYADKSNGILDSIVSSKNGQYNGVTRYQMNNSHIQKISTYDENDDLIGSTTFSNYNGDKPTGISLYSVSSQGTLDVSGTITYNGDDISGISLDGTFASFTIGMTDTYTYDTKNAPLLNTETMEMPVIEKHNLLTITTQLSVSGVPYSTDTTNYSYTYNSDDFPETSTYSGASSGSLEYVYEDK